MTDSSIPNKPIPLSVIPDNIPQALRDRPQWVVWKYELRQDKGGHGKWTKPPYDVATGRKGKTNDPSTWTTYESALAIYKRGGYSGIGFAFNQGDGLTGIDLDHCLNQETGVISEWAEEILKHFSGHYVERSPGGEGFRIFVFGQPHRCGKGTKNKNIELYAVLSPRYLTVTGRVLPGASPSVIEAQEALDWLHGQNFAEKANHTGGEMAASSTGAASSPSSPVSPVFLDDAALLAKIRASKQGAAFEALWAGNHGKDPSGADLALCGTLAFWTGKDADRMDRLFRQSGLMRDKWDVKHHADGRTYGQSTIQRAVDGCREVYTGGGRTGKIRKK
ncbi:hypothetical protein CCP3SC1_1680001 [Gammaproteobacteria bacterium]